MDVTMICIELVQNRTESRGFGIIGVDFNQLT